MEINLSLQLIEATLSCLEEEPLIFASQEDAEFFRKALRVKSLEKLPTHPPPQIKPLSNPFSAVSIPSAVASSKVEKTIEEPSLPPIQPSKAEIPFPHSTLNVQQLKGLFRRLFPQVPIIDQVPTDTQAKKRAKRWQTKNKAAPISILHLNESGKQKQLLIEVTKALDVYFGLSQLIDAENIEKEKQWEAFLSSDDLKVIITCDYTLWQLTDLMRFYKESKEKKLRQLGNTPLILLPDLSLYLKDPLLKRSLWKALCQKLDS